MAKRRRINPELAKLTERQYQNRIEAYARRRGYLTCHVNRGGRVDKGRFITPTSSKGFPDLWIVGHGRLIVLEIKTEAAPPSAFKPEQREWIRELQRAGGVEAYMVRPSDWPHVQALIDEGVSD